MSTRERTDSTHQGQPPIDPFEVRDAGEFIRSLTDETKAWLEAQKEYHTLVASERAARAAAGSFSVAVLGLVLTLMIAFLGVSSALWIGHRMNDLASAFLIVAGAYGVLGAVFLWLWRSRYRDRFVLRLVNMFHHG